MMKSQHKPSSFIQRTSSRNGSMTSRNAKDQTITQFGSRKNSYSSTNSNNDQPKIVRLNDRANKLSSNVDSIAQSYAQSDSQIQTFINKIQAIDAANQPPSKTKKNNKQLLLQKDFANIQEQYSKLLSQMKDNQLIKKCNEVDQLITDMRSYIMQGYAQSQITIQEMELLLKETQLQEFAKRDTLLERIKQEFLESILDKYEQQLEEERDREHAQIAQLEAEIDEWEEEMDFRFNELELQNQFIQEFVSNGSEESKLHETVRQWMLKQAREVEIKCEEDLRNMLNTQFKEVWTRSNAQMGELQETMKQIKRQTAEISKTSVQ